MFQIGIVCFGGGGGIGINFSSSSNETRAGFVHEYSRSDLEKYYVESLKQAGSCGWQFGPPLTPHEGISFSLHVIKYSLHPSPHGATAPSGPGPF